jgi:hypothetical protein
MIIMILSVDPSAHDAKKQKYLVSRREYLQRVQEEKAYQKMLGRADTKPAASSDVQREMKSLSQHLSIGVNMIAAMATAFFVGYYITKNITSHETTVHAKIEISICRSWKETLRSEYDPYTAFLHDNVAHLGRPWGVDCHDDCRNDTVYYPRDETGSTRAIFGASSTPL